MFFSVITENLNWEILNKNLVTFKRWVGVKIKIFDYYRGSQKKLIFRGGNQYMVGNCLKKGGWLGQFKDLRRTYQKRVVVFLRGVDTPMHTINLQHVCLFSGHQALKV